MLPFLRKKTPRVLGIDISTTAVKLLELSKAGDKYRVNTYGVEPLPPNAVVENVITDVEAVGDALGRLIARVKPGVKLGAIAVTGAEAITKIIEMDADLTEDQMEDQLELEAGQHISYPIDEVRMDFCVLGPVEGNPKRVQLLLVACRTENVQLRVDCLEVAGLKTAAVDVESYAIERSFRLIQPHIPNSHEHEVTALFDFGASLATLHVIHEGRVVYSRDSSFGGKQLTEEIQRRYGITQQEAGIAKKTGELPDDYESEVLGPFKDAVLQQISRSLQFFYSSSQFSEVDHIVLAGGTSSISGLPEIVEEQMGISASLANPFLDMTLASKVSAASIANDAPALMVACGLALRSFDE